LLKHGLLAWSRYLPETFLYAAVLDTGEVVGVSLTAGYREEAGSSLVVRVLDRDGVGVFEDMEARQFYGFDVPDIPYPLGIMLSEQSDAIVVRASYGIDGCGAERWRVYRFGAGALADSRSGRLPVELSGDVCPLDGGAWAGWFIQKCAILPGPRLAVLSEIRSGNSTRCCVVDLDVMGRSRLAWVSEVGFTLRSNECPVIGRGDTVFEVVQEAGAERELTVGLREAED